MLTAQLSKHRKESLDFGELDLTLRSIRIINKVPQSIKFVSELYLDGNHLLSLSGIQQFLNLEVFHFDYNYISLPGELTKIKNPFFLKEISFISNPIENDPALKLEKLRKSGFTRLMVLNPPHSLAKRQHETQIKEKESMEELSEIAHDKTERRIPTYGDEYELTSRKGNIGKICSNNRYRTAKNHKKSQTLSRQTRESTVRPDHSPFARHQQHEQHITPFEGHYIERVEEEIPGLMESESATARFQASDTKQTFSSQFLQNQKAILADYFYYRTLLQRSFDKLKQLKGQTISIEGQQSEIINEHLETLRYSLIKLKHESMRQR